MSQNPFFMQAPCHIAFSGGRTSAYMLRQILDAHGGSLPDGVVAVFANTGKERPETLDFVREIMTRWSVPVVWLEYYSATKRKYRVVTPETASTKGEPFEDLITKRSYLPNSLMRFCTGELKIMPAERYCKDVLGWKTYTNIIGLRYDEPRRVSRVEARQDVESKIQTIMPLSEAKVTKAMIDAYWAASPFDLQLTADQGNCDLCFLKGRAKLETLIKDRPDLADWWIAQEARLISKGGTVSGRFRKEYTYTQLTIAASEKQLFDPVIDDELTDCNCTD